MAIPSWFTRSTPRSLASLSRHAVGTRWVSYIYLRCNSQLPRLESDVEDPRPPRSLLVSTLVTSAWNVFDENDISDATSSIRSPVTLLRQQTNQRLNRHESQPGECGASGVCCLPYTPVRLSFRPSALRDGPSLCPCTRQPVRSRIRQFRRTCGRTEGRMNGLDRRNSGRGRKDGRSGNLLGSNTNGRKRTNGRKDGCTE